MLRRNTKVEFKVASLKTLETLCFEQYDLVRDYKFDFHLLSQGKNIAFMDKNSIVRVHNIDSNFYSNLFSSF